MRRMLGRTVIRGSAGAGFLALVLLAGVACGGDAESADDFDIDFSVASLETLGDTEVLSMTRDRLTAVGFLSDWLTMVKALQSHGQVMSGLGDVDPATANLAWVRAVHDASERAQLYHTKALRLELPADSGEKYEAIFAVYIAGVEAFGFASARLLEAGLLMGPSGRHFDDMDPPGAAFVPVQSATVRHLPRRRDGPDGSGGGDAVAGHRGDAG